MSDIGKKINKSQEYIDRYSRDASIFTMTPEGIYTPHNSDDICDLVRYVNATNQNSSNKLSITARAAGTCMSGGPLSESLVISFTEHMHGHSDIIDNVIKVEPGLYHRDLESYISKKGLMFASYPASKDLCAMGGIVNNNSGGEKTLKYGKTEKYIREMEMICSDGNVYEFKRLAYHDYEHMLNVNDNSFYSTIHREIYKLCRDNWSIIEKNRPKVSKNSAGYYLWNVYNPNDQSLDLSALFCGAQGTLGIMSSAKLELVPATKYARMLTFYLSDISGIATLVHKLREMNPESLELYDDHTFRIAMKYLPNMLGKMNGNIVKLALSFWPEVKMIISGGVPKIVIIAEFTDTDKGKLESDITMYYEQITRFINDNNLHIKVSLARSQSEADKYWVFRRESFNLLRSKLKSLRTVPFIEDVVVPADSFPSFMPEFERILDRHKLLYTIAGHAGDGNLHVIPLMKLKDSKVIDRLKDISDEVYALVQSYGGSITGEHNDGMVHAPFLSYMFDNEMLALFSQVKSILDPNNIFNPGKKVNVKWNDVTKYIDRRI